MHRTESDIDQRWEAARNGDRFINKEAACGQTQMFGPSMSSDTLTPGCFRLRLQVWRITWRGQRASCPITCPLATRISSSSCSYRLHAKSDGYIWSSNGIKSSYSGFGRLTLQGGQEHSPTFRSFHVKLLLHLFISLSRSTKRYKRMHTRTATKSETFATSSRTA